ncbi:hypothetical protein H4R19_006175, partial [Coemansia spiralis]
MAKKTKDAASAAKSKVDPEERDSRDKRKADIVIYTAKWEMVVKSLPKFSGARPLGTQVWLNLVRTSLERADVDSRLHVASARMCLRGAAADELQEWLGDDWEDFAQALLDLFDPVAAAYEITDLIHGKTRYLGLPSATKAVQLAIADRAGMLQATGDDLSRPILLALHCLLPVTTIIPAGMHAAGEFRGEIAKIRMQIALAKACTDADA